jgi:predicted RNA binding protein YcfA (HicA-like mRNA interferase family)
MPKTFRQVRRILASHGFVLVRITGSHEVWRHPDGRSTVVAAGGKHGRDVSTGTLGNIRRSTGIGELQ